MLKNKTFFVETYGCQMNVSDSTALKALLVQHGYEEMPEFNPQTGVVIINTCSVRHSAENRIYGRLGHYKRLKQEYDFILVVMGCMAEKENTALIEEYPFIDLVVGTHHATMLPVLIEEAAFGKAHSGFDGYSFPSSAPDEKYPFRAYVNIIHGCSNFCSYCIVPHVRGSEISRPPDEIIQDIERLIGKGVKEVVLLGQNVNSYGLDNGSISFAQLLTRIDRIDGLKRLKFITSHPKDFSFELIDTLGDLKTLSRDIHLPIQSGSDNVLKAMNRKYTYQEYLEKIERLRKKLSHPRITTDLLVGFPGETEKDYQETLNAVQTIRYDNAFMYKYSPRKGTSAYRLKEEISAKEKQERLSQLIEIQNKITLEKTAEQVNNIEEVLIESVSRNADSEYRGVTKRGNVVVFNPKNSQVSDIVTVKIMGVSGQTLKGEII